MPFPTRMTLIRLKSGDAFIHSPTPLTPDSTPRSNASQSPIGSCKRIDLPFLPLDRDSGYPWDGEIATISVAGRYMTEFDFFHRPSRTLILADLIENLEPGKLSIGMRLLARLGGCLAPDGGMPRDLRATFSNENTELRKAIETMIGWNPEHIIVAHGRWYESHGASELKRAFRWLLT